MVDIPDNLKSVYTATIQQDGQFVIDVPTGEVESGNIELGEQYRVAILDAPDIEESTPSATNEDSRTPASSQDSRSKDHHNPSGPPVEEGEKLRVTIESLGNDGDGIAKVEGGYVVFVPDTTPGEQPIVEIDRTKPKYAFATVAEPSAAHQ